MRVTKWPFLLRALGLVIEGASWIVLAQALPLQDIGRLQTVLIGGSLAYLIIDRGAQQRGLTAVGYGNFCEYQALGRKRDLKGIVALATGAVAVPFASDVGGVVIVAAGMLFERRWFILRSQRVYPIAATFVLRPMLQLLTAVAVAHTGARGTTMVLTIVACSAMGGAIGGAVERWVVRPQLVPERTGTREHRISSAGSALAAAEVLGALYAVGDQLILRALAGPAALAIYVLASKPLQPVLAMIALSRDLSLSGALTGRRRLLIGSTVFAAAYTGVALWFHPISRILATPRTTDIASAILVWHLPPLLFGTLAYASLVRVNERWLLTAITGFGLAVNLGLNVAFTRTYGAVAAAGSTVFAESAVAVMLGVAAHRRLRASSTD